MLYYTLSTSPHISKPTSNKDRPSKITLESLYEYIESLERRREERENHFKLELTTMLDNNHKSLENKIITLEIELHEMK